MKKNFFKKAAAVTLSAAMAMTMFTGCGGKNDGGNASGGDAGAADTSEHLDLKMYLIGDRSADFDAVYDEVNKVLEEELNCSLTVDFLSWSEHDTKYSLLFSSGEDFDLIFTGAGWAHYEQTAGMGGFAALSEDMVKTYAPDVYEVLPSEAWNQVKIQGETYMVPYYNKDFVCNTMAVRGDLLEKYGIDTISNWEEYKAFNLACAADGIYGSQGIAFWPYFHGQGMHIITGTPKGGEFFLYNAADANDTNAYYTLDWDKFTQHCYDMKEMADAGCWSPDILNSTDERQTGLLNGTTASMLWNLGSCKMYANQANAEHPEWNVTLVDPNSACGYGKVLSPYNNGGMAINASSKKKERALMVINELYTNPKLQDLTVLGIEGKHWEAVEGNQYKILDASGYPTDGNCNWGWNNYAIKRTEYIENKTPVDEVHDEILASYDANTNPAHPLDGFSFDPKNVTTQCAAVEAACGTYYPPLMNGLVDDVDATLAEYKAALESAGIRDIQAELESQIKAFLESK